MIKNITKRDGTVAPFDATKLTRWAQWAGVVGADWFAIVGDAYSRCPDACTTKDLQNAMIQACSDREDTPHLLMAGRLLIGDVYKEAFGGHEYIPSVYEMYHEMVALGLWEDMGYSTDDLTVAGAFINHSRDTNSIHSVVHQIVSKYAIRDIEKNITLESPAFVWMRMALGVCVNEPVSTRMAEVRAYYEDFAEGRINAPTPNIVNLGTPKRNYASCAMFKSNDNATSLSAGDHIAYGMTCASAGIGAMLQTRSKGDGVRKNTIKHGGKLPYYRATEAAVNANLQGCYSDDTDVLTARGFVNFNDLLESDLVAQVDTGKTITFVKPKRIIKYWYDGDMYKFTTSRKMGINLLVTPNHRMAWRKNMHATKVQYPKHVANGWIPLDCRNVSNPEYFFDSAEDFNPARSTAIDFGGYAQGAVQLTNEERLEIAFQADGCKKWAGNYAYTFRFSKQRKVDRFRKLIEDLGINYSENLQKTGVTSFYVKVGYALSKDFSWVNLESKSAKWAEEFLREAANWDGSLFVDSTKDAMSFCTTDKNVSDVLQAIACLCSAYCAVKISVFEDVKRPKQYISYVSFDKNATTGRAINKEVVEYSGNVHCVEVETGVIVVRRNGLTAVCGNSRGGAATMHFNCLDPEIENLLRLRHPTTVAKMKIGGIDYSFGFHPLLAKKAAANEDWMLVSYKACPELHEAMYGNGDFESIYDSYEKSKGRKKLIPARKLVNEFLKMQEETGRLYEHNTFEMNRHTPFNDTIYSSNLCQETGLPTKGYDNVQDLYVATESSGEIGLCNLASIVAGRVTPEMYEPVAYRTLKMVDNVISQMDYPFPHLEFTAKARRSAGVGITNLAHDLAMKGLDYTSAESKAYMHRLAEMHSYWLHKASVRLAKERGVCDWFDKTKYADGWLLIDTYTKEVDNITPQPLLLDWEGLRKDIAEHGMRNSVLEAFMPVESSSIAGNTTNGLYPIRAYAVIKTSGTNKTVFIAPDAEELRGSYQLAWDVPTKDMTEMYAIFQKFCGQGISADYYRKFDADKPRQISAKELLTDWIYRIKCGLKTKYYSNSAAGLGLSQMEDSGCTSCKL